MFTCQLQSHLNHIIMCVTRIHIHVRGISKVVQLLCTFFLIRAEHTKKSVHVLLPVNGSHRHILNVVHSKNNYYEIWVHWVIYEKYVLHAIN